MTSNGPGHFERDDNLESTRWSWLQANHAYVCVRVVEVVACEIPPTFCDRCVDCLSSGKPDTGRACSLLNWCISEVILVPLCPDLSCTAYEENVRTHGSLRSGNPRVTRRWGFGMIADITILLHMVRWKTPAHQKRVFSMTREGCLHQNTLDLVVQQGTNSVVRLECGAWQNTIRRCNFGCDIHLVGT